jgi:hypothetical protein
MDKLAENYNWRRKTILWRGIENRREDTLWLSHAQHRNRANLIIGPNLIMLAPGTASYTQPHKTCHYYVTSPPRAGHVPFTDNAYEFAHPHSSVQQPVPALRNRYNYDSRAVHYWRMHSRWLWAHSDSYLKDIYISRCHIQPPKNHDTSVCPYGWIRSKYSKTREAGFGSTTEMVKEWNRCYIYNWDIG